MARDGIFGSGPHDPLADLSSLLARERDAARIDMLAALDSVRWERLLVGMTSMVEQGPFRRSTATRLPAAVVVPDLVEVRHAAVVKAARRAKRSGMPADFHRLRIRCKRLRYSLEFSAELYGGRTGGYIRHLTGLQDKLGLMQDAEVAAARLAGLATGEAHLPASTIFVMGGMAEHHRREVERLLRRLPKKVSGVGGHEWQDLAATMERRRTQALALLPPARRTLRAVPAPPVVAPAPDPNLPAEVTPELTPPVATLVPQREVGERPAGPVDPTVLGGDGPA